LEKKSLQTPSKGLLGRAIGYALSQWDRLIGYLEAGHLKPDNNMVENAIRPFVLGRSYAQFPIMLSCLRSHGID
jgi:transposase